MSHRFVICMFPSPSRFLLDLFSSVCSRPVDGSVSWISPEPRVLFLLNSVPVPDPGHRLDVRLFPDLGFGSQPVVRPPLVSLPASEASFLPLLAALSPAGLCSVMALLLTEQKVVVHCKVGNVAGDVAIVLRSLLLPLQWELFFVPVVPLNMLGFLGACPPGPHRGAFCAQVSVCASCCRALADAPTPFLVGMPTRALPAQLPEDVYTVDLDRGRITLGVPSPLLPSGDFCCSGERRCCAFLCAQATTT